MKFLILILISFSFSCTQFEQNNNFENANTELWVDMLVEIPSGSVEKFELNKTTNQIISDSIEGKPRLINYLGYPANYGIIPNTLIPYHKGGDGDPIDIISIGPPEERGTIIQSKIIGVLKLFDQGESDNKLIAISKNATLENVNSLEDLKKNYPGILEIIDIWFTHYDGKGINNSYGFQSKKSAILIYEESLKSFKE